MNVPFQETRALKFAYSRAPRDCNRMRSHIHHSEKSTYTYTKSFLKQYIADWLYTYIELDVLVSWTFVSRVRNHTNQVNK